MRISVPCVCTRQAPQVLSKQNLQKTLLNRRFSSRIVSGSFPVKNFGASPMWKSRDDKPLPTTPSQPTYTPPAAAAPTVTVKETPHKSTDPFRADVAHIGKSVLIKGELSGSEDLYLDGEVE